MAGPTIDTPRYEIRGRAERRRGTQIEPTDVLSGAALSARSTGTLGATLADELGVANASFGPGVGLPQIRGQGGSRTKVMISGLGSNDASALSPDHAVMTEPALAERITVHRGPAAIVHGGSAIGGAVQIEDRRILDERPQALESRAEARVARDANLVLLRADLPFAERWVAHADIHRRDTRRVRIPGLALDEDAIRAQFGLVNGRNTRGFIGNSDAVAEGGSFGASRFFDSAHLGFNLSTLDLNYGLPPGGHTHPPGQIAAGIAADTGADTVRIDAGQRRLRVEGGWRGKNRWVPALRLSGSRSLYRHDEALEGRVETTFIHRATELRLEADTRIGAQVEGLLGVQVQRRDFAARGIESLVPRTLIEGESVFTVQRVGIGNWSLEAGARAEQQRYRPESTQSVLGQPRAMPARRFWPLSGSLAVRRDYDDGGLTVTGWSVARAPDVQELFAGGAHAATRTFDLGNTALDIETLRGVDLGLEQRFGTFKLRANVFAYRSGDYIVQRTLGWFYEAEEQQAQAVCARLDRCFPATKYEQQRARFHGYEAELEWQLPLPGTSVLRLFSDQVRGTLDSGGDVPRLAPQRFGFALESVFGRLRADTRWTRARAQERPGVNETPSAGYSQVDAGLRWTEAGADRQEWTVFLIGRNLGNAEIRNSASFLRNVAPEPGRSVQLGLQWVQ